MSIKQAATFGMRGKHAAKACAEGTQMSRKSRYKARDSPNLFWAPCLSLAQRPGKPHACSQPCALGVSTAGSPNPRQNGPGHVLQHAAKPGFPAKRSSPRAHRSPHPTFRGLFAGFAAPPDSSRHATRSAEKYLEGRPGGVILRGGWRSRGRGRRGYRRCGRL